MKKKAIHALYKDALKTSHQELERASALEALSKFDNLDLGLGEFVEILKKNKTWGPFSQLTLAELLSALQSRSRKPARGGARRASGGRKKAVQAAKNTPRRLTKRLVGKYVEAIEAYLAGHPHSRTADIAAEVGLSSKQAASILKKLRAANVVTTQGQRAGMVYSLKATKRAAPKKVKKAASKGPKKRPAQKAASKAARAPRKPRKPSRKK